MRRSAVEAAVIGAVLHGPDVGIAVPPFQGGAIEQRRPAVMLAIIERLRRHERGWYRGADAGVCAVGACRAVTALPAEYKAMTRYRRWSKWQDAARTLQSKTHAKLLRTGQIKLEC